MTEAMPRYRHYKGGIYTVICHARSEATLREVVVYRSEATGEAWVRDRVDFFSCVHTEKPGGIEERVPRFERIPPDGL